MNRDTAQYTGIDADGVGLHGSSRVKRSRKLQRMRGKSKIYDVIDEWLAPAMARWIASRHEDSSDSNSQVKTRPLRNLTDGNLTFLHSCSEICSDRGEPQASAKDARIITPRGNPVRITPSRGLKPRSRK